MTHPNPYRSPLSEADGLIIGGADAPAWRVFDSSCRDPAGDLASVATTRWPQDRAQAVGLPVRGKRRDGERSNEVHRQRATRQPVAVVTTTIPITTSDFHRELIRQLSVEYEVHVVSSPGFHLDLLAAELGVVTHALPMSRPIRPGEDLRALAAWVKLLLLLRPNIVVSATPKASLLSQLAAVMARVPVRLYFVGGLRLEGDAGLRRALLAFMEKATGLAATNVVVNSDSVLRTAEQLHLFSPRKVSSTTPGSSHGVDSAHFTPGPPNAALRSELGLKLGLPVLGFAGRLTRDKGIDWLVEALKRFAADQVPIQVLIVGSQDEPDSATYVEMLRGSGVHVCLAGAVSDMRDYYRLMDVHVLPSLREGFPNVVLESAACGVPSVTTTATGCIDSVVDGLTGLLVPVRDSSALERAILAIMTDTPRRLEMGHLARARVVRDFKPEAVVRSLLAPILTHRPKRVLHVIGSLGHDGAERTLVELCGQLRADGADARIAVLSPLAGHTLEAEAARMGVPVIIVGLGRFDPRTLVRLRPWGRGADVVHAHLSPGSPLAAAFSVPSHVSTEHSPTYKRLAYILLAAVDRVVHSKDAVVQGSGGNAHIVTKATHA